MVNKIRELADVILSAKLFPATLRLFLITEKEYIRIYYGNREVAYFANEFGIVRGIRLERGDVLDLFSKLEFFVNEIIQLGLLGLNPKNGLILDKVLENVDLFSRIKLLNEFGIIDSATYDLLMQTKQVRNGFAHAWSIDGVQYKGKSLKDNFDVFKQDMEQIWKALLAVYTAEQSNIDIQSIIDELKKLNPDTTT